MIRWTLINHVCAGVPWRDAEHLLRWFQRLGPLPLEKVARSNRPRLLSLLLRRPVFLHPGSLLPALRRGEGAFFSGCARSATAAVGVTAVSGFFGGRPLRFVGSCRTSMARLRRSRSSMRRATICSVGIQPQRITCCEPLIHLLGLSKRQGWDCCHLLYLDILRVDLDVRARKQVRTGGRPRVV